MKSNNLELALRRFEISPQDDSVSYDGHYCNGFSGAESSEAYYLHLERLYNDYFIEFRSNVESRIFQDKNITLQIIQSQITLFTEIKGEFELKSTLDCWISNRERFNRDMQQNSNEYVLWRKFKNQRDTVDFFIEMINTQSHFIDKAIDEIQQIYDRFVADATPTTPPTTLKSQHPRNDVDEYFEKHFANKEITNKEIELMFGIRRPTIQSWREVQGKLIQTSDEGKRPITYDKQKLIEYIKDGVIKERLKNIPTQK